ncbi:TIGR00341 family protein [Woodsholea maritima]|uniref:TIGR00341 family protein n=1 Tax=Woodsholea maritima TaxID=240237 RepID=UPI00036C2836|nr:TIGR00341 family protein [Woodsholea maritima]
MRLIELSFKDGDKVQPLIKATLKTEPVDYRLSEPDNRGRRLLRLVFEDGDGQKAMDSIQTILASEPDWRLVVLPVEATLPLIEEAPPSEDQKKKKRLALREEMYQDIAKGAKINRDFLVLTALSTVVAAIGLNADNISAVIGAMVIAPLLGPVLAFAFGSALGDWPMMSKAGRTALTGLGLGLGFSILLGLIMPVNMFSDELIARTHVGWDSTALALASGAAAALSMTSGAPAVLVGVMVAVALLPPAATMGLLLGAQEWSYASRAGLLLGINVVSVNLAALMVYYLRGVRPRTWLERRSAKRSVWISAGVWFVLIAVLTVLAVRLAPL